MSKVKKHWGKITQLLIYFRPNLFFKDFTKVDTHFLKMNNIRLFLCDLDNTLAPHFSKFPSQNAINFVKKIKEDGILFYVVSNNFKNRVKRFCEKLNPDGFIYNAKKPLIFKIKKLVKKLNIQPSETILMGDQFVIDVFAANRLGCKSILVVPLTEVNSKNAGKSRLINFLDKLIYKHLSQNNLLTSVDTKIFDLETMIL